MQARGGQGDQDVAGAHPLGAQHPIGLDDSGGGAGEVVLVRLHQAGVLGGLPAQQGRADGGAGRGDAADDIGDALGHHAPAGDVVGHEQRPGPDHDDIVDDHADQVLADGVMDAEGLGDRDLRAHAVGGGGQQGAAVVAQCGDIDQTGEAADLPDHGRRHGGGHGGPHEFDGAVAGGGVHAGGRIGRPGSGRRRLGHGLGVRAHRLLPSAESCAGVAAGTADAASGRGGAGRATGSGLPESRSGRVIRSGATGDGRGAPPASSARRR